MWTSAPTKRVDRVVDPYELHAVIFGRGRRLCLPVCFYVSLRAPERGVAISKCPTINFPGPMWAPAPTKRVDRVVDPYELQDVMCGRGRRLCLPVCFYVSLRAPERGVAISKCRPINFPGPMWVSASTKRADRVVGPYDYSVECSSSNGPIWAWSPARRVDRVVDPYDARLIAFITISLSGLSTILKLPMPAGRTKRSLS